MVERKILNPKTGRYVKYNGALGKKIRQNKMKGGNSEYPGNALSGKGIPYQRKGLNFNSVSCCGQKGGNADYPDSFKTPDGRWLSHPFDANAMKKGGGKKKLHWKKSARKNKQKGGADYPDSFKKQPYGGGKKKSARKNKQKGGADYPASFKKQPYGGGNKKKSVRKNKQRGGADYPASFKKQPYGGGKKKKSARKNKQKGGYNYEYPGNELSGKGWPYQRTDFPYKVGTNLDEKYLF
jgi:hypothetical protein